MCWSVTTQSYCFFVFLVYLFFACFHVVPPVCGCIILWTDLTSHIHVCGCYLSSSLSVSIDFYCYYSPPTHTSCILPSAPWLLFGVSFSVLTCWPSPLTCFTIINSTNLQEFQSVPWTDVKLSPSPSAESYRLYDFIHHAQMGCRQPYCTIFSHFPLDESLSEGTLLWFDLLCARIYTGRSHGFTLEVTNKSPSAESSNLL